MKRGIILTLAAAAALTAAGRLYFYLHAGMEAPEVLRKLSGMRLAVELYRQKHGSFPARFSDTVRSGTLEEAFDLKLKGHPGRSEVRDTAEMTISDTGGWAYVNAPQSKDFGLLYIDSARKDAKGRFWSEF